MYTFPLICIQDRYTLQPLIMLWGASGLVFPYLFDSEVCFRIAHFLTYYVLLQDGSSGDDFGKDSVEQDERRLTELGRRTVEMFVLTHLYT